VSALLEVVTLSQPALSRLIARLAARGLLDRCAATDDRRAVTIRLTDSGNTLVERAIEIYARAVHEALTSKFSETEQAALLQTLSQIGR
ncbi:MAG: MarR family transcriptional regulator, partial [Chloroflexi bacterium]|nr:MarR family transcriptional regulator [Chloroflexota bacterium]